MQGPSAMANPRPCRHAARVAGYAMDSDTPRPAECRHTDAHACARTCEAPRRRPCPNTPSRPHVAGVCAALVCEPLSRAAMRRGGAAPRPCLGTRRAALPCTTVLRPRALGCLHRPTTSRNLSCAPSAHTTSGAATLACMPAPSCTPLAADTSFAAAHETATMCSFVAATPSAHIATTSSTRV